MLRGIGDHEHRPVGDVQELVRDAPEQRLDATRPAGTDDGLVGVALTGRARDGARRRRRSHCRLVPGLEQLVVADQ